jgi:hypothetical protein
MLFMLSVAAMLASLVGLASAHAARARPAAMVIPTTISPAVALPRTGIDVEKLLAAGVQPVQFEGIVNASRDYLAENEARWQAADQALSDSREALELAVQEGEPANIEAARALLAQREAARAQVQNELFTVVSGLLDAAVGARLGRVRANLDQWPLPTKYLVRDRTEAEWIGLRDSLAEVAEAQSAQRSANPDALSVVAAADSDPETVAAAAALQEIAAARLAWRNAMQQ